MIVLSCRRRLLRVKWPTAAPRSVHFVFVYQAYRVVQDCCSFSLLALVLKRCYVGLGPTLVLSRHSAHSQRKIRRSWRTFYSHTRGVVSISALRLRQAERPAESRYCPPPRVCEESVRRDCAERARCMRHECAASVPSECQESAEKCRESAESGPEEAAERKSNVRSWPKF